MFICLSVAVVDCGSPPTVLNASLEANVGTTYLSDVITLCLTWVTSRLPVYRVISFIVTSFTRQSRVKQMGPGHQHTSNPASVRLIYFT